MKQNPLTGSAARAVVRGPAERPAARWLLPAGVVALVGTLVASAIAAALPAAFDTSKLPAPAPRTVDFVKDVQPILAASCYECHAGDRQKADLRWDVKGSALAGGHSGAAIVPGKSDASLMIHLVSGLDPKRVMPAKGPRLTPDQIGVLRAWIDQGAAWPDGVDKAKVVDKADHWAYKPLNPAPAPQVAHPKSAARVRNPIDAFVMAKLAEKGLTPSPEADRRTLIRRVSYDLTGLPPAPAEVDAFLADRDPQAYEKLVDRLLASPRYGERWARHWLDVVHYGDTHGYDKDKVRPNAWPYRDYVIKSLNDDKPYAQFVKEQLAGDHFYPGNPDGIVALGFIAAGPFDWVGHVELREGTVDKAITRNLDRDDMVATSMNTFVSLTAQCARCHDHKFDPIKQEEYYGLQAVFAAVDRADRPYDPDLATLRRRRELKDELAALQSRRAALDAAVVAKVGPELVKINQRLDSLSKVAPGGDRPEIGYHSNIEPKPDVEKWVQVDLGAPTPVAQVIYVGAHDTFNGIGDGFGFPVRYKLQMSNDPSFRTGVTVLEDRTASDVPNPGVRPQSASAGGKAARFVRMTATKLAPRLNDYIFSLAELMVVTPDGKNAARGKEITAADSIELPTRWARQNLVDGHYRGSKGDATLELATLGRRKQELMEAALDDATRGQLAAADAQIARATAQLAALPPQGVVFAAATQFAPAGGFAPTNGKPRPVHLLRRGSEKDPGPEVGPGAIAALPGLQSKFEPSPGDESRRRAALAEWVVDPRNPLTWRSIVNRVWQYHFGRGIVETANDFGRMGTLPTHPELLDHLAAGFRDGGQSLKSLHRLIVTSATYRQSSADVPADAKVDANNQYLWRMNRQRLESEAIYDTILAAAGKLDLKMGGPGYRDFGFEDDHSPRYKYQEYNPDDPATHRRAVYRMVVRSAPNPFMETLDCADPSQIVAKRNETLTPLQALALMNNKFVVRMAELFAARVEPLAPDLPGRIDAACRLTLCRPATPEERAVLTEIATKHGLASACRVILNTNEFTFVD